MKIVQWPGFDVKFVEVFRVLDLSGISPNIRNSKLWVKSGYVYLDGVKVLSIKDRLEVGRPCTISVRFPSSIIKQEIIMVICRQYYEGTPQRKNFR